MGNLSKPVTVLRPNRQTSDRENGATSASTTAGSGMGEDGGGTGVRGSGSGDGISAFAAIARGVGLTSSSSTSASTWRKQTLGSAVPSSDYDQVLNGDENAYPALPSRHQQQQQRRENEAAEGVSFHRRDTSKAGSGGDAASFKGSESKWATKKMTVSGGSGSEFTAPYSPDDVSGDVKDRGSSLSPATTGAPKKIAVSTSNSGAATAASFASGVAQERGSSSSPSNVAPKKIAVSTSGGVAQERGASSSPSTVAAPPTKTPVLATAPVDYAKKLAPIPEMTDR